MQPTSWRSRIKIGVVVALLFTFVYSGVYWSTPPHPYTSLNLPEKTHDMRFSPDGSTLLTIGDGPWSEKGWIKMPPIRVWDVQSGVERFSVAADWSSIQREKVCFSPDGRLFAADQACYGLSVWDARTGEEFRVSPRICVGAVLRFSPDGRFLLFENRSDTDGLMYLIFWDIRGRRELCRIEESTTQVVFAADGRSFATTHEEFTHNKNAFTRLSLWKLASSGRPTLEKMHNILASSVAFSPNLSTYAIENLEGGEFSLWQMADGVRRFADHVDEPDAWGGLRFLKEGRILVAQNVNSKVIAWDASSDGKRIGFYFGQKPWMGGCGEPSPDGRYVAIPFDDESDNLSVWPRSIDVGARLVKLPTLEEGGRFVMNGDREPLSFRCCPIPSVAIFTQQQDAGSRRHGRAGP